MLPRAITGYVTYDRNDTAVVEIAPDGKIAAGLSGWTVYVDYNGNTIQDEGELSTVSDSYGAYQIAGILPGSYFVRLAPQDGWRVGQAAVVTTLGGGNNAAEVNFTVTDRARIGGKVFYDVNGDGQRDAGDYPLAGWGVYMDANDSGRFDPGERRVLTRFCLKTPNSADNLP